MLFSFEACASQDRLQRSNGHILAKLPRYRNDHALLRMPELPVAAFGGFEPPAVRFQHPGQIPKPSPIDCSAAVTKVSRLDPEVARPAGRPVRPLHTPALLRARIRIIKASIGCHRPRTCFRCSCSGHLGSSVLFSYVSTVRMEMGAALMAGAATILLQRLQSRLAGTQTVVMPKETCPHPPNH